MGKPAAQLEVSKLDVSIAAANAFLDVVESLELVRAAEETVAAFSQFRSVVEAQVNASLKPGADASLAEAQLANASNQLLRARLSRDLSLANLANTIGAGGKECRLIRLGSQQRRSRTNFKGRLPYLNNVPILKAARAALTSTVAQRKILDKEYYPVFHLQAASRCVDPDWPRNGRDTQSLGGSGIFPTIPNYQAALIINWNFSDYFRLRAEKKVQDQRVIAQQQDYNLILQNLQAEDVRSRAERCGQLFSWPLICLFRCTRLL